MASSRDPVPNAMPLEGQARALLRSHPGDGLEAWLADQRWRAAPDGSWLVEAERDGWTYRIEGRRARRCGWSRGRPGPAPSPLG